MNRKASCLLICLFASYSYAQSPEEITNCIGMKLVLIPKGTFTMGSPRSEEGRKPDEEQHQVTISNNYYLGAYEVTQGQYEKIMASNPSYFQQGRLQKKQDSTAKIDSSMHPVEASWNDAVAFCKRLSEIPEEKKAGRVYRLPTEAEWEYACRANSSTAFSFGDSADSLGDHAWYAGNSNGSTNPVGEKKPNGWGLYDMHGNVREWCWDWYGYYPNSKVTDPTGTSEGGLSVLRGGSWQSAAISCRSAFRDSYVPFDNKSYDGFRVALSPSEFSK